MDIESIKPELDETLISRTKEYLAAVDAGDIDVMERFYHADFVNIRFDKQGNAVNISKGVFMDLIRGWQKQAESSHPLRPAEETKLVATSGYGGCASVLMLRNKGDEIVSYNFVWKQVDGQWRVLREFTFQDELPRS